MQRKSESTHACLPKSRLVGDDEYAVTAQRAHPLEVLRRDRQILVGRAQPRRNVSREGECSVQRLRRDQVIARA